MATRHSASIAMPATNLSKASDRSGCWSIVISIIKASQSKRSRRSPLYGPALHRCEAPFHVSHDRSFPVCVGSHRHGAKSYSRHAQHAGGADRRGSRESAWIWSLRVVIGFLGLATEWSDGGLAVTRVNPIRPSRLAGMVPRRQSLNAIGFLATWQP